MPTATTLSGYTITNWGPLTTTFTAPSSCATVTSNVAIGISSFIPLFAYDIECSPMYDWSCVPTGTITSLPPVYTALDLNPQDDMVANYFSPGLYCPSGWETVGLASRDGDEPVTSSGVVSPTAPVPTNATEPFYIAPANVFMQMLDPSETAVWCCPSSMTADTRIGCYSTLPDYKISTACVLVEPQDDIATVSTTFNFDGTTVDGLMETLTATHPMSTMPLTFAGSETSKFVAITHAPFVTLVHKSSDLSHSTSSAAVKTNGVGNIIGGLLVGLAAMVLRW